MNYFLKSIDTVIVALSSSVTISGVANIDAIIVDLISIVTLIVCEIIDALITSVTTIICQLLTKALMRLLIINCVRIIVCVIIDALRSSVMTIIYAIINVSHVITCQFPMVDFLIAQTSSYRSGCRIPWCDRWLDCWLH